MRRQSNVSETVLVGLLSETQLQDSDGFAAVGHGSQHAPTLAPAVDLDGLVSQRPSVRTAAQRHPLSRVSLRAGRRQRPVMGEADEQIAAEVRNQERHPERADRLPKVPRHDIGCGDRRRVFNRRQQVSKIES